MAGPLPPPPLLMARPLKEELFFAASLREQILYKFINKQFTYAVCEKL